MFNVYLKVNTVSGGVARHVGFCELRPNDYGVMVPRGYSYGVNVCVYPGTSTTFQIPVTTFHQNHLGGQFYLTVYGDDGWGSAFAYTGDAWGPRGTTRYARHLSTIVGTAKGSLGGNTPTLLITIDLTSKSLLLDNEEEGCLQFKIWAETAGKDPSGKHRLIVCLNKPISQQEENTGA